MPFVYDCNVILHAHGLVCVCLTVKPEILVAGILVAPNLNSASHHTTDPRYSFPYGPNYAAPSGMTYGAPYGPNYAAPSGLNYGAPYGPNYDATPFHRNYPVPHGIHPPSTVQGQCTLHSINCSMPCSPSGNAN